MIDAYNSVAQLVEPSTNLQFDTDRVNSGCVITPISGFKGFRFNKTGYYFVTFNATASAPTLGTDPITAQIYLNGFAVPGAIASVMPAAAGSQVSLSISAIIKVRPACPLSDLGNVLTIRNGLVQTNYTDVNITIHKLG